MEDDSLIFIQGNLRPHTLAFGYSLLCGLQAAIELSTYNPQSTGFSLGAPKPPLSIIRAPGTSIRDAVDAEFSETSYVDGKTPGWHDRMKRATQYLTQKSSTSLLRIYRIPMCRNHKRFSVRIYARRCPFTAPRCPRLSSTSASILS
jgi:hypothetical protein